MIGTHKIGACVDRDKFNIYIFCKRQQISSSLAVQVLGKTPKAYAARCLRPSYPNEAAFLTISSIESGPPEWK